MAEKLLSFFDEAYKLGGIKSKMRLAVLTNISSSKAQSEPDSPENIAKFKKAIDEVKKELS